MQSLSPPAKLTFLYLITNDRAHVSGIYYMPISAMAHDTGYPIDTLSGLVRELIEVDLIRNDAERHIFWVINLFRHQGRGSKNLASASKQLASLHNTPLIKEFCKKYPKVNPPKTDRVSHRVSRVGLSSPPFQSGTGTGTGTLSLGAKASRKRNPLFDAIAEVTGMDLSIKASGKLIGKVAASLAGAEEPYTPEDVREFGKRFWELCPYAMKDPQRERPTAPELEKNIGLLRAGKATRCQSLVTETDWRAK